MKVNQIIFITAAILCLDGFGMNGFAEEFDCPSCGNVAYPSTSIFDGINKNATRVAFYGWLQNGITPNEYRSKNQYNSPYISPVNRQLSGYSGNSHLLMLEQQSDLKLNQLWLGVQRLLDTSTGGDWGFQIDMSYGTDLRYCQSFNDKTFDYDWGHGDYYLSVVSLYGDIGYKNLSLRAGKFNSEMSNESFAATETFFYSKTYAFYNAPTVSGVRAAYQINDRWTAMGAWTAGENTSFENTFGDNGLLLQIRFLPTRSTSLKYSYFLEKSNGLNKRPDAASRYGRDYLTRDSSSHHVVFLWDLNSRWRYVTEGFSCSRLMKQYHDDETGFANGFNLNLFYKINNRWSIATRYEWLKARNTLYDLPYLTGGSGVKIDSLALGVQWWPSPRLNVRSELRYDWTDYQNGYRPFGGKTHNDQLTLGCAMTVKF